MIAWRFFIGPGRRPSRAGGRILALPGHNLDGGVEQVSVAAGEEHRAEAERAQRGDRHADAVGGGLGGEGLAGPAGRAGVGDADRLARVGAAVLDQAIEDACEGLASREIHALAAGGTEPLAARADLERGLGVREIDAEIARACLALAERAAEQAA